MSRKFEGKTAVEFLSQNGKANIIKVYKYYASLKQEEEEWEKVYWPQSDDPDLEDMTLCSMLALSKDFNANLFKKMDSSLTAQELATKAATSKGLSPLPSVFFAGMIV